MPSHIPQSNDELYNLSADIFNLNPFTNDSYGHSASTDNLNNNMNTEQYNAAAVQEELYPSSTADSLLYNLMDFRAENHESAGDIQEIFQAIIHAEDNETGNGAVQLTVISSSGADQRFMLTVPQFENFNPTLVTAPTTIPVMGSSMLQRTPNLRRGRQGPYTRRNFILFFGWVID